jgi:hypothetical protein
MMASKCKKSMQLALVLVMLTWTAAAQAFCFSFGTGHRNNGFAGWRGPPPGYQPYPWQGAPYSPVLPATNGTVWQAVPPQQWNDLHVPRSAPIR